MVNSKLIQGVHWVLFCLFVATAFAALLVWLSTENLPLAGFVAGLGAFFATASAFVDRLFPKGG